ncbi:hypothetical protein FAI40_04280 [Acetobacteraceae bacterium]|nr:hypothetical protein FAI40_04280 [Acetobacteraceae bacterium]
MTLSSSAFDLETLSAEIISIADEATPETLNLAKLRIDARKWFVGHLCNERESEKKQKPLPLFDRIETILIDPKEDKKRPN